MTSSALIISPVVVPLCAQLRNVKPSYALIKGSSSRAATIISRAASSSESSPLGSSILDPLRSFPWAVAVDRLCSRLLDLAWASVKLLTVPALLVSSASEIQYALLHGTALVVPLAMLLGVVLAGVMNDTTLELSEQLRQGEIFPWHLIVIGMLFALIKLPGPVYPFWGRILLPHFANGGLWQACYLTWQSRSR